MHKHRQGAGILYEKLTLLSGNYFINSEEKSKWDFKVVLGHTQHPTVPEARPDLEAPFLKVHCGNNGIESGVLLHFNVKTICLSVHEEGKTDKPV